MTENKTNGSGRFPKGVSGNPAGRPPGSRNRASLLMESLLEEEAETLTRKAIELAKGGDMMALRLCLERILPTRKDRPIQLSLPPAKTVNEIAAAMGTVCTAIAEGQITPSEGEALSKILLAQQAIRVQADFESRLDEIEYRLSFGKSVSDSKCISASEGTHLLWESTSQAENSESNKTPEEPIANQI